MAEPRLRKGFTTGAAAAAAAKAALSAIVEGRPPCWITIAFLTGETTSIPVDRVEITGPKTALAEVIKDGGDDPDITHKARIGARVSLDSTSEGGGKTDSARPLVRILGGHGVGKITRPGLELPVGEPAINPGPRTMIRNSVAEVFLMHPDKAGPVTVEVYVPEGDVLAQKTLNARLGILGGISILGTTGIVTPMSHDAYIATIKSSIDVARAGGSRTLVFTTGRRSERFAMEKLKKVPAQAFIQTGDFFKAGLDMAGRHPGINTIIYAVFFGKAVKMAMGFEHTHAAKSDLTLNRLAGWAHRITGSRLLADQITSANTARHAFSYIYPEHTGLVRFVGERIIESARRFSGGRFDIRVMIFDFDGAVACQSHPEAG